MSGYNAAAYSQGRPMSALPPSPQKVTLAVQPASLPPSPQKARAPVRKAPMLPEDVFQASKLVVNTTGPSPMPSPMSRPLFTPSNAATTHWRTVVCPHPPVKTLKRRPASLTALGAAEDTPPSSGGLMTPANLWPTPRGTPAGTPTFLLERDVQPQAPGRLRARSADSATPQSRRHAWQAVVQGVPASNSTFFGRADAKENLPNFGIVDPATPSPDKKSSPIELQPSHGPYTPDDKPVRPMTNLR
mmetsp:Transcript_17384/g.32736  ORF Transcript_17384/g.32736 Transcript_17384/m.32736 type:complete len:245 (-) Transcript_17384:211-945(-)